MIIWPDCSLKTLKECETGAIVRLLEYHATGAFGIACDVKGSENRALVSLEKDGPEFELISKPEEVKVLEYSAQSILRVDQEGPFEATPRSLYDADGCLLRSADGWRMNVHSRSGVRRQRAQYDFTTKTLQHISSDLAIGAFGKWRLVLVNPDRPHDAPVEIGSFTWKEREKELS